MQHVTSIVTNICFSKYITKKQGSIVDAHFICFSTLDHFITVPGAGWLGCWGLGTTLQSVAKNIIFSSKFTFQIVKQI